MITNGQRALLIGWRKVKDTHYDTNKRIWWYFGRNETGHSIPPQYDIDLNACAELRAFVQKRNKRKEFQIHLWCAVTGQVHFEPSYELEFELVDATPAQQCIAFDAVFKNELEKV